MARPPWGLMRAVLRRADAADGEPLPDAELLDRFVRSRDEAAFELLLWRHAGMVLGVCRRVLADDHLAEDAFQATFLVLARKADTVRRSASVAGWLHRVARRVALRAAKRRRAGPILTTVPEPTAPPCPAADGDLRRLLDEEIDRLPKRFRLPVVLCYVQDRSTDEAARLLGVPRGTVLSRLATARQRLAGRLTRRGVALSAGLPASLAAAEATASADLIRTTLAAALDFVTPVGPAAVGGSAVLAREVLGMTGWQKPAAVLVVLFGAVGVGTAVSVVADDRNGSGKTSDAVAATLPTTDSKPSGPTDTGRSRDERLEKIRSVLDDVTRRRKEVELRVQDALGTSNIELIRQRLDSVNRRMEEVIAQLHALQEGMLIARERYEEAQQAIAKARKLPIPEDELDVAIDLHPQVRTARQKHREKSDAVILTSRKLPKDDPKRNELQNEVNVLKNAIEEVRARVRPEVESYLRVPIVLRVEREWAGVVSDFRRKNERNDSLQLILDHYLTDSNKLSSRLVEASRFEEELNRLREFEGFVRRQQLQLELGIDQPVRTSASTGLESKMDAILRELADVRKELKRQNLDRK